jgi:hypothetical protein
VCAFLFGTLRSAARIWQVNFIDGFEMLPLVWCVAVRSQRTRSFGFKLMVKQEALQFSVTFILSSHYINL